MQTIFVIEYFKTNIYLLELYQLLYYQKKKSFDEDEEEEEIEIKTKIMKKKLEN